MEYTVNNLASLSGVSVRTLHYYDEIGLLRPSHIRENGYRVYGEKEVLKLQQILFFRELEFSLDQINDILSDPAFDQLSALKEQKKMFELKKMRIEEILKTIDHTLKKGGEIMSNDTAFKGLSDKQLDKYKEEAKKRWGQTDAYQQSVERTKNWTKADYDRVAAEHEEITRHLAEVRTQGVESSEVQNLIERHYQYVSMFYDVPLAMYKNLGQMYVDDPRFTATYDRFGEGMAVFVRDAIAYFVKTKQK